MSENNKYTPSYYSVIPAEVRYSKELSAQEKLLYSEISALTNVRGYCWASNAYFAELYGQHKVNISKQINKLAKLGFIHIEITYRENSKQIEERRLFLNKQRHRSLADITVPEAAPPPPSKPIYFFGDSPPLSPLLTPLAKTLIPPLSENAKGNNTNIELNNTSSHVKSVINGETYKEMEKNDSNGLDVTDGVGVIDNNKNSGSANANPQPKENHIERESHRNTPEPVSIEEDYTTLKEKIKKNILYNEQLSVKHQDKLGMIDEIVIIMLDTIMTAPERGYITIGGEKKPHSLVKEVFLNLESAHIEDVLIRFISQQHKITHKANYIRTCLYNVYIEFNFTKEYNKTESRGEKKPRTKAKTNHGEKSYNLEEFMRLSAQRVQEVEGDDEYDE